PSPLQSLRTGLQASWGHADHGGRDRRRPEDMMLKKLSICTALIAFATSSADAQQREAVLQKVAVPGASFDIVVAMPKPGGATYNLDNSPDALVVRLVGGELAIGFDDPIKMIKASDHLRRPIGAFRADNPSGGPRMPVSVYVVPAGE